MLRNVRLHPLFLLLILAALIAGSWTAVTAYLLSLALHEATHLAAARALGFRVGRIDVYPFGGRIEVLGLDRAAPADEALVAVAGPLANVVVLALMAVGARLGVVGGARLQFVLDANAALFLLNLVPALPLDGGRLVRAWFASRLDFASATRRAVAFSRVVAACFVAVGGVGQLAGYPGWQLGVIGAVVWLAARDEQRRAPLARWAGWLQSIDDMRRGELLPLQAVVAGPRLELRQVVRRLFLRRAHRVYVQDESLRVLGSIGDRELYEAAKRGDLRARIRDLLSKSDDG